MQDRQPALAIRPVDPHDADEMLEFQALYELAERAELADSPVYSLEDAVAILTRAPVGSFYRGYVAMERDRMVGEGLLTGSLVDSLETARLWAWVPPAERRRGVGGAIVDHLVDECRALGRTVLQTTARYPFARRDDHPYRRFAERHGFRLANLEVERRLDLPVPEARLAALAAAAAPYHRDYRLREVVGPIPGDLAQGFCDVQNRLPLEAPAGELVVEAGRRTPEVLADQDLEIQEAGRTRLTVVALDAGATVVALTSAVVAVPSHPHVFQYGTIVRSADRGHRLGQAVKVANLRLIQRTFPDKRFISTTNAETNAHMVAINEELGFERYALSGDFQRLLADEAPPPVRASSPG